MTYTDNSEIDVKHFNVNGHEALITAVRELRARNITRKYYILDLIIDNSSLCVYYKY